MILFCPRCGAELLPEFKGEWFDSAVRCAECGLGVADPPLMLARGPADDEVEYSLEGWQVEERAVATAALAEVDIPFRWEPGLILVVPAVAEDEVDALFDDLGADDDGGAGGDEIGGDGEDDDEDDDGGEEAQAAMADLFVAADRLQHAPADPDIAAEAAALAAIIAASSPPYGIARPVWRRIQALSSTLAADVERGADEETVAGGARAVRDFLRDLV